MIPTVEIGAARPLPARPHAGPGAAERPHHPRRGRPIGRRPRRVGADPFWRAADEILGARRGWRLGAGGSGCSRSLAPRTAAFLTDVTPSRCTSPPSDCSLNTPTRGCAVTPARRSEVAPPAAAEPHQPAGEPRPGESRGMRRDDRAPHDRLQSKRRPGRPARRAEARAARPRPRRRRPRTIVRAPSGCRSCCRWPASPRAAPPRCSSPRAASRVNGVVVTRSAPRRCPMSTTSRSTTGASSRPAAPRYILLNKPRGFVTTRRDPEGRRTVLDLLGGVREYVYPVGRLDYDTEGLLLLTSDGDLAARLTHPRHEVPRIYEAIVAGTPSDEAIDELRRGVYPRRPAHRRGRRHARHDHRQGPRADHQAGADAVRGPQPPGARDVRAHRPSGAHAAARAASGR